MTEYSIHTGFWINWNKGIYAGATFTLPSQTGLLLVAFVALFVRLSGSHLWGTLRYIIHQFRATPHSTDGLSHQVQATLNNTSSDADMLWGLIKLTWTWRRASRSALARCLPLMMAATFHMVAFAIAGIFSSQVTTVGDGALVHSQYCGWMDEVPGLWQTEVNYTQSQIDIMNSLAVTARWSYQKSSAYSRGCYREQPGALASICSTYSQPRINSVTDSLAACPFASTACEANAFMLDSGHMDSALQLGINAQKSDRISLRQVTSCAPILVEKYSTGWQLIPDWVNTSGITLLPNDTYMVYEMGPLTLANLVYPNSTFVRSNYSQLESNTPYYLFSVTAYGGNPNTSDFSPVPDFRRNDSDVTLVVLCNAAVYFGKVKDPWFKAENLSTSTPVWLPSRYMSVLGCSQQYQFCNQKRCSPLTGMYEVGPEPSEDLGLNENQIATYKLLWKAAWGTQLGFIFLLMGNEALIAEDYLWGTTMWSSPLPENQWQIEVQNLHNVSLALLQQRVVEYASPPNIEIRPGLNSLEHVVRPNNTANLDLCSRVKIRTTDYSSFSVLGLSIIMFVGTIIITTNIFLAMVISWIQKRTGFGLYKRLEWIESGALQLQRMASEGRGIGPWGGYEDSVPVPVMPEQKFSLWRLSRPNGSQEQSFSAGFTPEEILSHHGDVPLLPTAQA